MPGPTMMHDFNVTEGHVVFMDLPVVFDLDLAMQGTMPYRWDDGYGARLGVVPRGGADADVRWYEIDPCYVFHPMNAYDDDGCITLDVVRYARAVGPLDRRHRLGAPDPLDHRPGGRGREGGAARRPGHRVPRVDPRVVGRRHRFGYSVQTLPDTDAPQAVLVKYDQAAGTAQTRDFGAGRQAGEPVFVPAGVGGAEDDGWVMTYVYDTARDTSDFVVVDARDFEGPPVATVPLPQRVPVGFHGSWIADA